LIAHCSNSSNF